MADKTGMNDLLDVLERLCTDYRAMEYLLDHYLALEGPGTWRKLLRDSRKAVQAQVAKHFHGLRGSPQFDQPFGKLIEVLNETTLIQSGDDH